MGNENIIRNEAEIVFSKLIFSREFIIQQASIQPKKNKLNQLKESSGKKRKLVQGKNKTKQKTLCPRP